MLPRHRDALYKGNPQVHAEKPTPAANAVDAG
jgi:hypothetical protein